MRELTDEEFEAWLEGYLDKHGYAPTPFEAYQWCRDVLSSKSKVDEGDATPGASRHVRGSAQENGEAP